jgi:hypothetical protein
MDLDEHNQVGLGGVTEAPQSTLPIQLIGFTCGAFMQSIRRARSWGDAGIHSRSVGGYLIM